MYQVNDWLRVLAEVAKSVPISFVCRDRTSAGIIAGRTKIPVFHSPDQPTTESLFDQLRVGVVLYLNQYRMNFDATGYPDAFHVFVSHGESDKSYMSQNSLKIFDYFFVAGEAARERISKALPSVPAENIIPIGRPQLHFPPPMPSDINLNPDLPTLMYAPTWEGTSKSMAYSSVVSHGVALAKQMVEREDINFIYRPHPFLGMHSWSHARADRKIRSIMGRAQGSELRQEFAVDKSDFGWHLTEVDWLITDVSAVAYDWLHTKKPALVLITNESESQHNPLGNIFPMLDLKTGQSARSSLEALSQSDEFKALCEEGLTRFFSQAMDPAGIKLSITNEISSLLVKHRNRSGREGRRSNLPRAAKRISSAIPQHSISARKPYWYSLLRQIKKLVMSLNLNSFSSCRNRFGKTPNLIFLSSSGSKEDYVALRRLLSEMEMVQSLHRAVTIISRGFWGALLVRLNLNRKHFSRNVRVKWTPTVASVENTLNNAAPETVLYTALRADNQICLRFGGFTHVLWQSRRDERIKCRNSQAFDLILCDGEVSVP